MIMIGRAVLAIALLLLAGAPAEAQELRIGVSLESNSIDPMLSTTAPNAMLARHFFDELVQQDERQRLKPGLAVSWQSIEPTVWEFRLRAGVKFHDGSPFTAEDVAFSLRRAPTVSAAAAFGVYTRAITEVEIVDPLTVRIHSAAPYPLAPYDLSVVPIISHRVGDAVTTADFNSGKAAIGTGPFRFVRWTPGDRIEMARNDGYWGPKPAWARVTTILIPNDSARVSALLAHDVDLIDTVPPSALADIRTRPDIRLALVPFNRLEFLHMDSFSEHPPFRFCRPRWTAAGQEPFQGPARPQGDLQSDRPRGAGQRHQRGHGRAREPIPARRCFRHQPPAEA